MSSFSVAPGDPEQISRSAALHQELADELEYHQATIHGTSKAVLETWNGEAAQSYGQLATVVASHFQDAAGHARNVSAEMGRWARELTRCQADGKAALQHAEHWLGKQNAAQKQLTAANNRVAEARTMIADAQTRMASPSPAVRHAAAGELAAAEDALGEANTDVATATNDLTDAEMKVLHWEQVGREAWEDAIKAATRATGTVESVHVLPPPLAGWFRRDPFTNQYRDTGVGAPAGPNGAIWARAGHDKPPDKPGYRTVGVGNGGWIYVPIQRARGKSKGPTKPSQPAGPSQPAKPSQPAGPSQPAKPTQPAGPSQPAGPGLPPVRPIKLHVGSGPSPKPGPTPKRDPAPQYVDGNITLGELTQIGEQHGWSGQQINDWVSLCKSESNGTINDTNQSSGAYGIAQFIEGPSEYAQYGGNATSVTGELTAMANYIADRYGNPSAAWSFHLAHNWY